MMAVVMVVVVVGTVDDQLGNTIDASFLDHGNNDDDPSTVTTVIYSDNMIIGRKYQGGRKPASRL